MMDFRNPVFSSPDNSTVDAEVKHPSLGWIPFTAVNGDESTQELFDAMQSEATAFKAPPVDRSWIDAERDRRISGGFLFEGVKYQSRPEDRENMSGAALGASIAISDGAQEGDLQWDGSGQNYHWIAADNTLVPMDAQTVVALGKAALAHKKAHIFAARALKDMNPVPSDFTDDRYWPTASGG